MIEEVAGWGDVGALLPKVSWACGRLFIFYPFFMVFYIPSVVIDTLPMARRKFPMAPATLDALCSRAVKGVMRMHRNAEQQEEDPRFLFKCYCICYSATLLLCSMCMTRT